MMECNKEEAIRAKDIAEKRMHNKDFLGARKIALKARQLFPELDNISQMLTVCEVHCSAAVKVNGEMDWYGILQVEPSADDSSIKKQYRKLALLLHPDKNKFAGAEAAFKLVGEAHMTLSDRAKRSLHDIKRNANVKIVPSRQPSQQAKNNTCARSNAHNMNFNGLNQQQQQPSAFSGTQTFWTICPTCGMRYQYYRTILNRALRCQNCMKPFIAYDLNSQAVPPGATSGYSYNSSGIPTQQVPSQQAHNTSQQTQFGRGSSSTAFQCNVGGTSAANSEREGGSMNKTKEGSKVNVEVGAGNEVKFEKVKLTEVNKREQLAKPSKVNTSQKRGRKAAIESSDSDSTDGEDIVIEDGHPAEQGAGVDASHCLRRSSRQKQNVRYNEDGSDNNDDDEFMNPPSHKRLRKGGSSYNADRSVKDFSDGDVNGVDVGMSENNISEDKMDSKQKRGNMCDEKLPNGSGEVTEDKLHESKRGTIEKEEIAQAGIDSSVDSSSKASPNVGSFLYPDPEFYDFEKLRSPIQFAADQIWAVYDNLDGMPRFYARIRHVYAPTFKLRFTWLEHEPTNKAEMAWSDEELPVACGNFRLGKSELTEDRLMFSHVISWEKGRKRNSYDIYPRKGEVWALYKDWDIGWSSDPDSHRLYEYEIVEVVSDFTAGTGITVVPLVKIKGYVSLFIRTKGKITASCVIPSNEILRFSHSIPSYRMTGAERGSIPKDCFELDSASLPNNFEESFHSISLDSLTLGVEMLDDECNGSYPKTALDEEKLGTVKIGETENMKRHGTNGICEEKYHASASQNMATTGPNHINETKASRVEIDKNNVDPQNANADSDAEYHDPSTSSSQSPTTYVYPESEFHNFEQDKAIEKFQHGQIWALYSDFDKYPKYYGWIRKVELEDFRVHMIWLEACPSGEEENRWLGEELPIGCGTFKAASGSITYDTMDTFSHLVRARPTGRKNQYVIVPGIGEIWAVYKKWRAGWTLTDLQNCEYDLVEICEHTGSGIEVSLLTKVNGYRAVFRPERKENALAMMVIPEDEFLRFSHQIPAFQLNEERGGKLRGYWELDPASVPESFLFTNVD
ncbi:Heat shock protein DnaJ N-terminal domain-containing protein [Cocos nucifera]|uniref:Heat shock protein DnaJ N-terminal domain-containing protein n=1 Tax=Cocos nucifera TaxID=13894 RepID=A0A8K0MTP9_COCNU|nr:Heat shock protein DnaJ N-terminal domain-containing protein [Cocos nucifera]